MEKEEATVHSMRTHCNRIRQNINAPMHDDSNDTVTDALSFVKTNCLTESEALELKLPTTLVLDKRHKVLMFSSQSFYNFIKYVELVYSRNLSVKMLNLHGS